jgi:pantetheine-phosphate adenylyltransferase
MKKAVYAGSFDPFTNGHLDIVKDAAMLFDHVCIMIAHNSDKKRLSDADDMFEALQKIFKREGLSNCYPLVLKGGLVADFCKAYNVQYLIRGLRNTSDYMYEENIAKINKEINPNLLTIYFRANNDVISSSMIRELIKYGKDVSKYVPEEVYKIL